MSVGTWGGHACLATKVGDPFNLHQTSWPIKSTCTIEFRDAIWIWAVASDMDGFKPFERATKASHVQTCKY